MRSAAADELLLLHETSPSPKRIIVETDALILADVLADEGHEIIRVGAAAQVPAFSETAGAIRLASGATLDLASFDGALLCVPSSVPWRASCERLLTDRGVFVFQSIETARAASDKLRSLAVFSTNDVPTPRTLGFAFDRPAPPADVRRFLQDIDCRPCVVKKSYGWGGRFVRFPESAEEAAQLVWDWHRENLAAKRGGVLAQEFIDSGEGQKRDYRIHTLVARDDAGNIECQIAAAVLRIAPPGELMISLNHGAERRRLSFDFDEGEQFYVGARGLTPKEYRERVETGAISFLPEPIAALARKTALAFGLGYLGQDIIVRRSDDQAFVLEVNPFAGAKTIMENDEGFSLYRRWAKGFARTVAFEKARTLRSAPKAS